MSLRRDDTTAIMQGALIAAAVIAVLTHPMTSIAFFR